MIILYCLQTIKNNKYFLIWYCRMDWFNASHIASVLVHQWTMMFCLNQLFYRGARLLTTAWQMNCTCWLDTEDKHLSSFVGVWQDFWQSWNSQWWYLCSGFHFWWFSRGFGCPRCQKLVEDRRYWGEVMAVGWASLLFLQLILVPSHCLSIPPRSLVFFL